MYINRGLLLKIILQLKSLFEFFNKHFYILVIISTISHFTNNKFFKVVSWIVKFFLFLNIIFGISYILYLSLLENSFYSGINIYTDLVRSYIDYIINIWNEVIKIDIENNIIKHASSPAKTDINIQIKEGIKEAIKEVIDETLDKIHESELQDKYIKNVSLAAGLLILGYFIFVIPGSGISTEELSQYNWFNQSLIELKGNIVDFFTKPGNPGDNGNTGNMTHNTFVYSPNILSPSTSVSTEGVATVTPNTPIISTISTLDKETQTTLDGITVSKFVEMAGIMQESLSIEAQEAITGGANKAIKTIID